MTDWTFEEQARADGYGVIAGMDEAGRGPLAGPVVAAAVILPMDFDPTGVRDSKMMTAAAREKMFARITSEALAYGVGIIGPEVIDEINILRATHRAMRAALNDLGVVFDFILVDGRAVPELPKPSRAIVKGDSKSVSIAAASIIAKVTRDRIMVEIDGLYPEYGFAGHKGYGSKLHLEAINRLGPCPCHRKSFSPIAERKANCQLPGLD
ncbi:MAG: ribonuclease HII [Armatimonadetes bacterium]|nr:ribonuclease HII [Armatimonadota bacterium]